MTKILIVEDEILIAERIEKDLIHAGHEIAGSCDTGEEAIEIIEKSNADLVLMDIRLAGAMNGIETAKLISKQYPVPIIFITDVSIHVSEKEFKEALDTLPANYITKPFRTDQLLASIQQVIHTLNYQSIDQFNQQYILLKQGTKWIKLAYNDIIMLKADGMYCQIILKSRAQPETVSYSLSQALKRIHSSDILRIHKSYAINMRHFEYLEGNQIMIADQLITIGPKFQNDIRKRLNRF